MSEWYWERTKDKPRDWGQDLIDGVFGIDRSKPNGGREGGDENTQAVKELTRTIKDQAEMIGGGQRAKSALPTVGMKAMMMTNQFDNETQYMGAFTIG